MAPPSRSSAGRRRLRRIRITGWTALSSLIVTIIGFLVWASTPYPEQPEPIRDLLTRSDITVDAGPDHITVGPAASEGPLAGEALLFFPGARVNPHAYATTFADTVAATGLSVTIVRPWWNLAITDPRDLTDFQDLSDAEFTGVGGHSMGGVKACDLAAEHELQRLVLMASYCATDLSGGSLDVLSLSGSNDLLVDPVAVDDARQLLPDTTREVNLEGLNHASFGDYGPQTGDGEAGVSRAEAIVAITEELVSSLHETSRD